MRHDSNDLIVGKRLLVGSLGSERVKHIKHGHHANHDGLLIPDEAIGVPAPIKPLVVMAYNVESQSQGVKRATDVMATERMRFHDVVFFRRQSPWLIENRIWDADLPNIMKNGAFA